MMSRERMICETQRLIIRRFTPDDLQAFSELIRDKMNSPYAVYDEPFPVDEEGIRTALGFFIESEEFFALEEKASGRLIGFVSLNQVDSCTRNLGYCLHSRWWKKGLGSEAVQAIIHYAEERLHVVRLVSGTAEENVPSVKLLQKAGFAIMNKCPTSFANDENGKPIMFTGLSFEYRFGR